MNKLFKKMKTKRTPLTPRKNTQKPSREADLLKQAFFAMVILTVILGVKRVNLDFTNRVSHGISQILTYELKLSMDNLPNLNDISEFFRGNLAIKVSNPGKAKDTISLFPPTAGTVTSPFGMRTDPFTGNQQFHSGIDISAELGTPVYAAEDGIVMAVEFTQELGNSITLDHNNGFYTVYGHLSKTNVTRNQWVKKGDIIGEVGNTGRATGYHLHFELWKDKEPLDPMQYIDLSKK